MVNRPIYWDISNSKNRWDDMNKINTHRRTDLINNLQWSNLCTFYLYLLEVESYSGAVGVGWMAKRITQATEPRHKWVWTVIPENPGLQQSGCRCGERSGGSDTEGGNSIQMRGDYSRLDRVTKDGRLHEGVAGKRAIEMDDEAGTERIKHVSHGIWRLEGRR